MNSNRIKIFVTAFVIISLTFLASCDDDPEKEDVPELITKATLTFTPSAGTPVVVTATDPDGEGVQDISPDGPINLATNTNYTLTIQLVNALANPSDPEYDVTEEVQKEGDEHMFFFGWTNNLFIDPVGDGNIDDRADDLNYDDDDDGGLPIGLQSSWLTSGSGSGTFRILLKHQPGLKTTTSNSSVGETDLDIEFTINIQ